MIVIIIIITILPDVPMYPCHSNRPCICPNYPMYVPMYPCHTNGPCLWCTLVPDLCTLWCRLEPDLCTHIPMSDIRAMPLVSTCTQCMYPSTHVIPTGQALVVPLYLDQVGFLVCWRGVAFVPVARQWGQVSICRKRPSLSAVYLMKIDSAPAFGPAVGG